MSDTQTKDNIGKQRKRPTKSYEMLLLREVDACCPICHKYLFYNKGNQLRNKYEIAHIYPFSAKPEEEILLSGLERLSDDLDSIKNLIILCRDCHKFFDQPRTAEGYLEMVELKKRLIQNTNVKDNRYNSTINEQMSVIINEIQNYDDDKLDDLPQLSLSIKTIDEKVSDNGDSSINNILKRNIKTNVTYYYTLIEDLLKQANSREIDSAEEISMRVKLYYIELKRKGINQKESFNFLVDWLHQMTGSKCRTTSEIIISYFVQHCEVFE